MIIGQIDKKCKRFGKKLEVFGEEGEVVCGLGKVV
jgi:hypothetical protein